MQAYSAGTFNFGQNLAMRAIFYSFFKLVLFWLIVFNFWRILFLLYYFLYLKADEIPIFEAIKSVYAAFALDLSTAAYISVIPLLLLIIKALVKAKAVDYVLKIYVLFILIVYGSLAMGELGLYAEWKTKLSYKALVYLKQPAEVLQTVGYFRVLLYLSILAVLIWLFYKLFIRWIYPKSSLLKAKLSQVIISFFILFPLLFIAARGGFQAIPVSISSAYYSNHQLLNVAAVNPLYNISVSMLNAQQIQKENIFKSMPEETAKSIVAQLHDFENDTLVPILTSDKPNIVIMLLESWSADLIESLGGEPGITPNFREMESEGLLFTNFYANANRSQQAIGSLYGGLPGIPLTTITDHPEKYHALPSLSKDLRQIGYTSAFYFGGQLNYGNILSYLIHNELDVIIEGKDFPRHWPRGKLGVHDGILLPWAANALSELKEPFFSTIFTLSSHAPYDYPMEHVLHWPKIEKPYVNGAYYTDMALGEFFAEAKNTTWYENTLFIVLADHSKNTYKNHPLASFEYHKIPLLLAGPALKEAYKGKQFDKICGNTDLPATLLKQLGLSDSAYFWSKDIFNPYTPEFAYFELNEGLGWKRPYGYFVWDKMADRYIQKEIQSDLEAETILEGKAYLQQLFDDFINY